jgi:hypothetical protein
MRLRILAIALAAVHLVLVVCGAAHFRLVPLQWGGIVQHTYGALSGSDSSFGFFAPGVASQLRATFTMTDDEGRTWTDVLEHGNNREARLRLGTVVSNFAEESMRRDVAASCAATMFGRHPTARQVVVRVEVYELPPMDAYRDGARPEWVPVYEVTVSRENTPQREER